MNRTLRRRSLIALSGLSVAVTVAACGSNADAVDGANGDAADIGASDSSQNSDSTDSAATDYADGSYSAAGSYSAPSGQENIEVDLTVADGVVTEVTVTPEATDGTAARFQQDFASAVADQVVGQELAGLSVDKVSGSSLTGDGFNAALDQIRADATA
ncbi:FMN-binding protein [Cellulomonas sp. NPDC089187]|uniref:FMN-binding protein n=1 Tax=Cellulomonas sp. NPDC089187 TaxID=3154970 RepID=UPI003416C46D